MRSMHYRTATPARSSIPGGPRARREGGYPPTGRPRPSADEYADSDEHIRTAAGSRADALFSNARALCCRSDRGRSLGVERSLIAFGPSAEKGRGLIPILV